MRSLIYYIATVASWAYTCERNPSRFYTILFQICIALDKKDYAVWKNVLYNIGWGCFVSNMIIGNYKLEYKVICAYNLACFTNSRLKFDNNFLLFLRLNYILVLFKGEHMLPTYKRKCTERHNTLPRKFFITSSLKKFILKRKTINVSMLGQCFPLFFTTNHKHFSASTFKLFSSKKEIWNINRVCSFQFCYVWNLY